MRVFLPFNNFLHQKNMAFPPLDMNFWGWQSLPTDINCHCHHLILTFPGNKSHNYFCKLTDIFLYANR